MIGTVLKAEFKNMLRDKMYLFFALYPVLLGAIGYYLIDYIEKKVPAENLTPEIVAMFLILMTGYVFGALIAFTLLDDKDDNVLMSLKITPISVKYYVIVKLVVSFIFGFIATLVITLATGFLPDATFWTIILISFVGALQAPGVTLIVNSFSSNKVEGFVVMKLSGLILIVPVIAFFVMDWQEIFLVFAPGFWPARMIQIELLPMFETNFNFIMYFILGVIYNMGFLSLLMKIYTKKSNL
jgi:fluoroquinolone transport system permease protein